MALLDLLNRFGLFLDRSNFGLRVGNFRSNTLFENSLITQNVRNQAARFEKQFDLNRGSVKDFEKQFRPKLEKQVFAPIESEIEKTQKLLGEAQSKLISVGRLQRSAADILSGRPPRGSGGYSSLSVQRQVSGVLFNRKLTSEIINPLTESLNSLFDIRTQERIRINEIFKTIAPNSSV